jgi:hypothetical protein
LASCGFERVYQDPFPPSNEKSNSKLQVKVFAKDNKTAYVCYRLKKQLDVLFSQYQVSHPTILKIEVKEIFDNISYSRDANPSRSQGRMIAKISISFPLKDPFYKGTLEANSSYTPDPLEQFANTQAKRWIEERLVFTLANDIRTQTAAVLEEGNQTQ